MSFDFERRLQGMFPDPKISVDGFFKEYIAVVGGLFPNGARVWELPKTVEGMDGVMYRRYQLRAWHSEYVYKLRVLTTTEALDEFLWGVAKQLGLNLIRPTLSGMWTPEQVQNDQILMMQLFLNQYKMQRIKMLTDVEKVVKE